MRISAIAILVVLFLWPAGVFGQSPELMDAYNRVNELYVEGRYQEAIPFAMEALHLSEQEFGPAHRNTGAEIGALPFDLIARDNRRRFGLRCICIVEEVSQ